MSRLMKGWLDRQGIKACSEGWVNECWVCDQDADDLMFGSDERDWLS